MVWATTSLYDGNKKVVWSILQEFWPFYKKGNSWAWVVIDLCKWNGMTLWGKKHKKMKEIENHETKNKFIHNQGSSWNVFNKKVEVKVV